MSETDSYRQEGDDADDNYAAAYLDDDQADDGDLAEMFAKVQSIQETEGRRPTVDQRGNSRGDLARVNATRDSVENSHVTSIDAPALRQAPPTLNVTAMSVTTEAPSRSGTPKSLTRSPSSFSSTSRSARGERSADGIKTISRHSTRGGPLPKDALLGPRKPQIFDEKILQSAMSTDMLERLKQKAVIAPPGSRRGTLDAWSWGLVLMVLFLVALVSITPNFTCRTNAASLTSPARIAVSTCMVVLRLAR